MTTPLLLVDDSATEWALAAQLVAKIESWQLVSQVVQKRHFGEQETWWDNHFKRWKVFFANQLWRVDVSVLEAWGENCYFPVYETTELFWVLCHPSTNMRRSNNCF